MTYPGGKGHLYQRIINQIPPHRVYIEPFVGGGAVLLNKRPGIVNIAIDSDPAVIRRLRSTIANNDGDTRWQILNTDALRWLTQYQFHGDEFVYADPPYLMSTRRQHRPIYRCELHTPKQHQKLLDILTGLPCMVMISGYFSDLYAERLAGWRSISFEAQTRGGSPATEYLWMSYPQPNELHDYNFLGDTFRERERIKRKKARWLSRLRSMPALERAAIVAAIAEDE